MQLDYFNMRKQAPLCWYNKSSDLRASAGALWMSMRNENSDIIVKELGLGTQFSMPIAVWHVYIMLCGMALELLYKAICVAKGKKIKITHDLVKLADMAGVNINDKSKAVLSLLTESIIWEGKYPVPTDSHKESFFTANNLYNDIMYLKVQSNSCEDQKPTDSLNWYHFNKIWLDASKIFWKNHT